MAEGGEDPHLDGDKFVIFPCDLPQWTSLSIQLATLVSVRNPNRLISKLQEIQEQVPMSFDCASSGTRGNSFKGLAKFLFEEASEEEQDVFFAKAFPCLIRWCLRIEQLRPVRGLQFNHQHEFGQTVISRQLVASILACAFLSLFPYRKTKENVINVINFEGFFSHPTSGGQYTKLRCILHYYERLADLSDGPQGNLVFTRKGLEPELLPELDDWCSHCQLLCPLHIHPRGLIMDAPPSVMQVHFSNRKYGGNTLGAGQTQEEIRLCQSPELLVGLLFVEAMAENEAVWVQGHEIFSMCSGHAHCLKFAGDFRDPVRPLANGELPSLLCFMDPLSKALKSQYEYSCVLRELNKAYAAFFCPEHIANSISLSGELQPVSESSSLAVHHFAESLSEAILLSVVKDLCFPGQEIPLSRPSPSNSSSSSGSSCSGGGSEYSHSHRLLKERSDSESSHDGHSPYDIDRTWIMSLRRRSSNLSDASSRRSSDLTSRRSSSSTRQSSDFSSEFEDFFETFQRQELRRQHAVIKEECSGTSVQDYIGGMVTDLVKEGTTIAVQMAPGVQDFAAYQPPHVARPTPVKPQLGTSPSSESQGGTGSSSGRRETGSSNQTDDQKLKGNIVTYVEHLLSSSMQSLRDQSEVESARVQVVARQEEAGAVGGVDIESPRIGWEGVGLSPSTGQGRSPASSEMGGSPALSTHSGESLTDDLKQAVVESVRGWSRRSQNSDGLGLDNSFEEFQLSIPVGTDDDQGQELTPQRPEPGPSRSPGQREGPHRDHKHRSQRSASLGSALTFRRLSEGFLQERTEMMYGYAEGVVMNSIQNAVEEVYGYKEIPISFSKPPVQDKHLSRSLPSKHASRKGSVDDTLSSFATHLARRCSLDDLSKTRRRSSSSGFRDIMLSTFEDELRRSNPRLEMFEPLSQLHGSSSSLGSSTNYSRRRSSDFLLLSTYSKDGAMFSSSLKGDRDSPLSKAILLDFLSTSSTKDSCYGMKSSSHSSNLEWFAQDLLLDSFNDAFSEIYGNDFAEEMEQLLFQQRENAPSTETDSQPSSGSPWSNTTLESFVENVVNSAMQDALQVITQRQVRPRNSRRSVSLEPGEEDVESLYEDAIDVPYRLVDKLAVTMSSLILEDVKVALKSKENGHRDLQDEYYQRRRRWRRKQRFPGVEDHPRAVATGNWGCGVHGGDPQLKLLLQWVAASISHISVLHYYTCSDEALSQVRQVCTRIITEGWSAADLLDHILLACQKRLQFRGPSPPPAIFDLIFESDSSV